MQIEGIKSTTFWLKMVGVFLIAAVTSIQTLLNTWQPPAGPITAAPTFQASLAAKPSAAAPSPKPTPSAAPKTKVVPASPIQVPAGKPFGLAMGDNLPWLNQAQLNNQLTAIANLGIRWIRIDVSWADVQPNDATHFDWSGLDRVVSSANSHGLKILSTLAYTPKWAGLSICAGSQQCQPADNSQFANFARSAVQRYARQGLRTWEIWNEPNLQGFWKPAPDPAAYAALLKAADNSIKQLDPGATVMTGGLGELDSSSLSIQPPTFFNGLYQSGAKNYFDAVGFHPYSFPAMPSTVVSWSGWSMMNDLPNSIRAIMTANGDAAKQIWITEFGAPTNGLSGVDHVSEATQATMLTDAATQYKSDPWLASFFWYNYQDLGTDPSINNNFFGLLRIDGSQKPAYAAMRAANGY